jgi:hypothetical protein
MKRDNYGETLLDALIAAVSMLVLIVGVILCLAMI